jgi:hypothetical protein
MINLVMILKYIGKMIFTTVILIALTITEAYSWGGTGHRIINRKAPMHLPASMSTFKADSLFYESHASDADNRRSSSDTTFNAEQWRHYIDIDIYPNFQHMTHSRDSAIMLYGYQTVKTTGMNPWAAKMFLDSLTAQFYRGATTTAKQTASDLGHYIADGFQPLHCTENYNGQLTGNTGIHSRYETDMLGTYSSSITILPASVQYIASPIDYIFDNILYSNTFVDSIIAADNYAKDASGWNGSGSVPTSYYTALWAKTQNFTKDLFQRATVALANLWYTAAVNAGTAPLPIQLASFVGINMDNNAVKLQWMTVSEINNYGFFIERKNHDGQNFIEIPNSFLPGYGTTTETHEYTFVDNTAKEPRVYDYRLKQVDNDGLENYSQTISIDLSTLAVNEPMPAEFRLNQNYPNPFNPATTIKFSVDRIENATIIVYDVLGKEVAKLFDGVAQPGSYYKVQFDATSMSSGVYFYRIQTESRSDLKKMILMK